MKGRKRHLLVDTEGVVLKAVVSAAAVLDRNGGELIGWALKLFGPALPRLVTVWVDGAYEHLVEGARAVMGWELEVVRRPEGQKGFVVQKQRWKVERTFAWLGRFRRLSKDYEYRVESSEAFIYLGIYLGMSVHMLRRLAASQPAGST